MDKFQALADPTRRKIVEKLASTGQLSASEISALFPISPQAVSQHLKILREAQLVRVEKRAQQRIYQLNYQAVFEIEDWAIGLKHLWNRRFDDLEKVIEAEKKRLEGGSQ